ncbi:hypothetical protein CUMW_275960 [Citrus unshiu]|uniref:Uncharacterized protein n=1 Tax=Citrus unshiu TaxID=55188 RepID=A0A2H5N089_CITUN|nr:hypothetical protein CUMW_275960 [Citrus unshiu]
MGLPSKSDLPLISTRGIREIMGQYFPLSFLHLFSINGQSSISSRKSDLGRPSFEKYLSLGQLTRRRVSNEKAILLREMTQDLDIHISESFEDGGDYANRQVRIPEHRIFQLQLISTGKAEQPEERKQAKRSLISASL